MIWFLNALALLMLLPSTANARALEYPRGDVPADIYAAYKQAYETSPYVCPRTILRKTDERFTKSLERIRLRYAAEFGVINADEIGIFNPTHCPSPENPAIKKQMDKYRKSVKALEAILRKRD